MPVVGGELYYIIVDGYGGASGNYTLDITGMDCLCFISPVQSLDFGTVKDLY